MCGLSTVRVIFFAVSNNRPVRVIGRAGKRQEITVSHMKIPVGRSVTMKINVFASCFEF